MTIFKDTNVKTGLDRNRVADQIFRELRDLIILGTFVKGEKLPAERELASRYKVSGPTIREAIRALAALGLVNVRHGSGTYVTADSETLIAMSLGTVIQLEGLGVSDVLTILSVLNAKSAELACTAATQEDKDLLVTVINEFKEITSISEAVAAIRNFHQAIAAAAHNPLLSAICGFLVDIQTELAEILADGSFEEWQRVFAQLGPIREKLVEDILTGDKESAVKQARKFHVMAFELIQTFPKAREARLTDPELRLVLASMMSRIGKE
ncbi:MAG: FadR family transcriptional regulator [Emcibacter sp.]|nr:FadR family transcriptional regulator [Emcibacter sp.]